MQALYKYFKLVLIFAVLSFSLASFRLFSSTGINNRSLIFLPMIELVIIFILLQGGKFYYFRFASAVLITAVLLFYNIGEIFYRYFYLEHFSFVSDIQLLPGLFSMILPQNIIKPSYLNIFTMLFSLLVLLSISLFILLPAKRFIRRNMSYFSKREFLIVLLLFSVLNFVSPDYSPYAAVKKDFSTLSVIFRDKRDESVYTNEGDISSGQDKIMSDNDGYGESAIVNQEGQDITNSRVSFPGIRDSDIHMAVIESYGAALIQRSEYRDHTLELYNKLLPYIENSSLEVRSGYVNSPAFGGRSWLADASLLAAVQIKNQQQFDERIKKSYSAYFLNLLGNEGYHRYYVAPGTTRTSEEWKTAYPFDNYIIRKDFGYEGPNIAFGTMTDQFALEKFSSDYLDDNKKEFCFYLLVSSHTPFERIPVFKPDWDFSMKGKEYESGYLKIFDNNWLTGNELAQGYLEGISYSLETTVRYLTERLSGEEFAVIIGDHQPRKPVSGPDPGFPVIFHVISPEKYKLSFPEEWNLSRSLKPPPLPEDYDDIPDMGDIPQFIESVIRSGGDMELK